MCLDKLWGKLFNKKRESSQAPCVLEDSKQVANPAPSSNPEISEKVIKSVLEEIRQENCIQDLRQMDRHQLAVTICYKTKKTSVVSFDGDMIYINGKGFPLYI